MKVILRGKITSVYTSEKTGVTYVGMTDIDSLTPLSFSTRTVDVHQLEQLEDVLIDAEIDFKTSTFERSQNIVALTFRAKRVEAAKAG